MEEEIQEEIQEETQEETQEVDKDIHDGETSQGEEETQEIQPETQTLTEDQKAAIGYVDGLQRAIQNGTVNDFIMETLGDYMKKEDNEEEEIDPIEDELGSPVAAKIIRELKETVDNLKKEIDGTKKRSEDQQASDRLRAKYPDAEDLREGIIAAIKENPGISLEAAYKIAKFEDKPKPISVKRLRAAKGERPIRSGKASASNTKDEFRGKTLEEVFELSKRQLNFV